MGLFHEGIQAWRWSQGSRSSAPVGQHTAPQCGGEQSGQSTVSSARSADRPRLSQARESWALDPSRDSNPVGDRTTQV